MLGEPSPARYAAPTPSTRDVMFSSSSITTSAVNRTTVGRMNGIVATAIRIGRAVGQRPILVTE